MDYSRFRYEAFENRSNVYLELSINSPYPEGFVIDKRILEVARILFRKEPRNTYIFTGAYENNLRANLQRMEVWRDDEIVGKVATCYIRGRYGVSVDNPRIRTSRAKGGAAQTSDTKKAANLVVANFVPASNADVVAKAIADAHAKVTLLVTTPVNTADATFRRAAANVQVTMQSRWATVGKKIADLIGLPQADQARLDEVTAAVQMTETLRQAGAAAKLRCVILKGDDFCITELRVSGGSYDAQTIPFRVLSREEVPASVRQSVGMLKLTEVGKYIEDVGVRISDNVFVVFSSEPL